MTTIIFNPENHSYSPKTKTFYVEEKDVEFDESYTLVKPDTDNSLQFDLIQTFSPTSVMEDIRLYQDPTKEFKLIIWG